jgi:hypothetical protein
VRCKNKTFNKKGLSCHKEQKYAEDGLTKKGWGTGKTGIIEGLKILLPAEKAKSCECP